jgi:hypothetical protein
MTEHGTFRRRGVWQIAALIALAVSIVLAGTASNNQPAAAAQVVKAAGVGSNATDSHGCPLTAFCAFSGANFTGSKIEAITCGQAKAITFTGVGSWDNNQDPTLGPTRASLRNSGGGTILTTASAHSTLAHFDWLDIFSVVPC